MEYKIRRGPTLLGALVLALSFGACGDSKTNITTSDEDPSADLQSKTRPTQKDPPKAPVNQAPTPEVRISSLTGKAEYQKRNGPWTPLDGKVTLDINDSIRVAPESSVTILLPDDSQVELGSSTEVHFSQNERREISLAYGTLSASMKVKTTDRLGLQVRTLSGLVRGPRASFSVVAPPFGDVLVAVRSGVVYAGDEKKDLALQAERAKASIAASAAGKNPPAPEKDSPFLKLSSQQVALMKLSEPVPLLQEGQTPSPELLEKFRKEAEAGREALVPKALAAYLKNAEDALSQAELFFTDTNSKKEENIAKIQELNAARQAKDQEKVKKITEEIRRSSRLLISVKRQAHLLALEAGLRLRVLAYLGEAGAESAAKTAITGQSAKLTALKDQWTKTSAKANGLRPRSRVAAPPGRRPRPNAARIPIPAGKIAIPNVPGASKTVAPRPKPSGLTEDTPGMKGP